MVISQGDVCWASLDAPSGSGPGFRRPVTIVHGESFNASPITTVVVPLTGNLRLAAAPGNVILSAARTGRRRTRWPNVLQLLSIDRTLPADRVGHLPAGDVQLLLSDIDLVLGRE